MNTCVFGLATPVVQGCSGIFLSGLLDRGGRSSVSCLRSCMAGNSFAVAVLRHAKQLVATNSAVMWLLLWLQPYARKWTKHDATTRFEAHRPDNMRHICVRVVVDANLEIVRHTMPVHAAGSHASSGIDHSVAPTLVYLRSQASRWRCRWRPSGL